MFKKISDAERLRAKRVNLVEYCEFREFDMVYEGNGNYRLPNNGGLIVKENYFNHFGGESRGDSIEFCRVVLNIGFWYAVHELLDYQERKSELKSESRDVVRRKQAGLERKNEFVLPDKNIDNKRVFAYLTKTRRLPEDLVNDLFNDGLLFQDTSGNCVFPCYQQNGQAMGAIVRGTISGIPYKKNSKDSDSTFGWVIKPNEDSDTVLVTESPIDAMSFIALYPDVLIRKNYILALGGVNRNVLKKFLTDYPNVKQVVLGLDNDGTAEVTVSVIKTELESSYKIIDYRPKSTKDWNEELLAKTS